jgi:hypothetical protein
MMALLVCGGRHYNNLERAYIELDAALDYFKDMIVIQGDATGADCLAKAWCAERGIHCASVPALWERRGRRFAGPLRNSAMLALKPHAILAFPGGSGTEDMIRQGEKAGIPVYRVGN